MKIECVEGIVLTDINYSESSKILNILTIEHGLIGVMAKGCRKMKSKLRGTARKMIYGKFHIYYKEGGLSTVISIDVINSFNNILSNLDSISYASYLLELSHQVVKQTESKDIFSILKNSLERIEEGISPYVIVDVVELKYLDYLGVRPNIDSCALCGNTKEIITLNHDVGGFLCKDCYKEGYIVKSMTIKLMRALYYIDLEKVTKLEIKREELKEIDFFLKEYYDKYTGIYLKSKKMLEKINNFVES